MFGWFRFVTSFPSWSGIVSFLGRPVRWNDAEFRRSPDGRIERRSDPGNRDALDGSGAPAPLRIRMGGIRVTNDRGYLRTLFLHPPSYEGFDGGAGARIKRGARSAHSGTRLGLAQPAALVPGSRLIDAPPAGLTLDTIRPLAAAYDLAVLHTSTRHSPTMCGCRGTQERKTQRCASGSSVHHVAVNPQGALSTSTASTSSPATSSTSRSRKSPKAAR